MLSISSKYLLGVSFASFVLVLIICVVHVERFSLLEYWNTMFFFNFLTDKWVCNEIKNSITLIVNVVQLLLKIMPLKYLQHAYAIALKYIFKNKIYIFMKYNGIMPMNRVSTENSESIYAHEETVNKFSLLILHWRTDILYIIEQLLSFSKLSVFLSRLWVTYSAVLKVTAQTGDYWGEKRVFDNVFRSAEVVRAGSVR